MLIRACRCSLFQDRPSKWWEPSSSFNCWCACLHTQLALIVAASTLSLVSGARADTACGRPAYAGPAANMGPKRVHQRRTVSWQMSMPHSCSKSSTFLSDSG